MSAESFPSLADILADDALLDALAARTEPQSKPEDADLVALFKAYIEQAEGDPVPAFGPAKVSSISSWPTTFPQQRTAPIRTITVSRKLAAALCLLFFPVSVGTAWVAAGGLGSGSRWLRPTEVASAPGLAGIAGGSGNEQPAASPEIIMSDELAANWTSPVQSEIGANREALVPDSSWPKMLRAALVVKYALPTVPVWAGRNSGPTVPRAGAFTCTSLPQPTATSTCARGRLQ